MIDCNAMHKTRLVRRGIVPIGTYPGNIHGRSYMTATSRNTLRERRKGRDILSVILTCLRVATWIALFVSLIFFGLAKPQTRSVYDTLYNTSVRTTWDQTMISRIIVSLYASFCISIAGLLLSLVRGRRKNERYPVSLVLAALISFNVILLCFYFFRG